MGNKKNKNLDDLKKDIHIISNDDLNILKGGKDRNTGWGTGCGGIVPQ